MTAAWRVTVNRPGKPTLRFFALGRSSTAIHATELERFGGLCSVAVLPIERRPS
ncbi:MAG: hypothetical protein WBG17_05235 [Burkholderiaceae bacterium]